MDIRRLTPELWVSPQITPEDVGEAATQGARAVICNRPDGESADQPAAALIRAAAEAQGMAFFEIPVVPGAVGEADVAAFRAAMAAAQGPALAYCRTGTRSAALWALAEAPHLPAETILKAAAEAGYDLSALRPRLEAART